MYYLMALFTHFLSKECVPYPYETEETKDKCCICKKKIEKEEE